MKKSVKVQQFVDVVLSFYSDTGIHPIGAVRSDVEIALGMRAFLHATVPFKGDHNDIELVRDIMLDNESHLQAAWAMLDPSRDPVAA
jgi:hypothetical protein